MFDASAGERTIRGGSFYRVMVGVQHHSTVWGTSVGDVRKFMSKQRQSKELDKMRVEPLQ